MRCFVRHTCKGMSLNVIQSWRDEWNCAARVGDDSAYEIVIKHLKGTDRLEVLGADGRTI